jgi:spore coat protein U-like protein
VKNQSFLCTAPLLLALPATLAAQPITYSQQAGADTFVSSGQPDTNFGTLGVMELAAPTASQPRTEMTLQRQFNVGAQSGADAPSRNRQR